MKYPKKRYLSSWFKKKCFQWNIRKKKRSSKIKIEKEKDKEILSKEQKIRLFNARKSLNKNKKNLPSSTVKNVSNGDLVNILMLGLEKSVVSIMIELFDYCSWDEWKSKDKALKLKLTELFFYLYFGVKNFEMKTKIAEVVGGKNAWTR